MFSIQVFLFLYWVLFIYRNQIFCPLEKIFFSFFPPVLYEHLEAFISVDYSDFMHMGNVSLTIKITILHLTNK